MAVDPRTVCSSPAFWRGGVVSCGRCQPCVDRAEQMRKTNQLPTPIDLEDILERAFWKFDALHKAHYRDVEPSLPGPMSERDAFKRAVRSVVLADVLGVPQKGNGDE